MKVNDKHRRTIKSKLSRMGLAWFYNDKGWNTCNNYVVMSQDWLVAEVPYATYNWVMVGGIILSKHDSTLNTVLNKSNIICSYIIADITYQFNNFTIKFLPSK